MIGTLTGMESRLMFTNHAESPLPEGDINPDRVEGRDNQMRATSDTLTRPRKAPVPLCIPCRGTGQDPQAPARPIPGGKGDVLYLVRICPACEGQGVRLRGEDRDLARFDYLTP